MFVEVGKQVSVENLIQGMIVQSGNDATVALAEHVAGTEPTFVQMMNAYAKQLGMTGSHFMNAAGMPDPNHYMTARDAATLARAVIREFPEYYKLVLAEGIHLERHHAAEPQRAAVARPDRGRRQDRPHRDRGLLPDRLGEARRHAARLGGARHRLDEGARGRERSAAQLRLQLLRDEAHLRRRPAAHHGARLEGRATRGGPRAAAATCTSRASAATSAASRPSSNCPRT